MGLACHIVTGDNWRTARIVAAQLGIINVQAEVLPAGKAEVVCTPCFLLILLLLFLL
jgi:Cu+-exporting ATPase